MEDMEGRRLRERAVLAITQKHNLQKLMTNTRARVSALEAQAELARQCGQEEARRLLNEKQKCEQALAATLNSFEQALQTSEDFKAALRREEERIRRFSTESFLLRTQWKNSQRLLKGAGPKQVVGFLVALFLLLVAMLCRLIWLD